MNSYSDIFIFHDSFFLAKVCLEYTHLNRFLLISKIKRVSGYGISQIHLVDQLEQFETHTL